MTDRIVVEGIRVEAIHGWLPSEKIHPQPFVVDLTVELDLSQAGRSDRLDHTVDYGGLIDEVVQTVTGESWNLIERVAERVAEVVLSHPRVEAVEVTVHKPEAPTPAPVDDVAVTVRRRR